MNCRWFLPVERDDLLWYYEWNGFVLLAYLHPNAGLPGKVLQLSISGTDGGASFSPDTYVAEGGWLEVTERPE